MDAPVEARFSIARTALLRAASNLIAEHQEVFIPHQSGEARIK
jgi:hypothetical protein